MGGERGASCPQQAWAGGRFRDSKLSFASAFVPWRQRVPFPGRSLGEEPLRVPDPLPGADPWGEAQRVVMLRVLDPQRAVSIRPGCWSWGPTNSRPLSLVVLEAGGSEARPARCVLTRQRSKEPPGAPFIGTPAPLGTLPLWPNHLPKPRLLVPSLQALGL